MADLNAITIQTDQALVTIDRIEGGKPFIGESPFIGQTRTMSQILDELDYAARVLRMNVKTLVTEDITEQVAQAWLERTDAEYGDTDKAPFFVLTSEAYRVWNMTPEPYVNHHKQYGTTNHAQTGVSR